MTCTHCGATVPDGEDRCRKCLRRSGVVASEQAAQGPPPRAEPRGIRAILVFVALVVALAILLVGFRVYILPD